MFTLLATHGYGLFYSFGFSFLIPVFLYLTHWLSFKWLLKGLDILKNIELDLIINQCLVWELFLHVMPHHIYFFLQVNEDPSIT